MKIILIFWLIALIGLFIWMIGTFIVIRGIEKPKYTLIQDTNGYEIREYQKYILAEVLVVWNQEQALNKWFSLLAGYIFGWNNSQKSISMTVPINDIKKQAEKISMTTPVNDIKIDDETHLIQFILPSSYTMQTLPIPDNANVILKEKPAHKAAVLRYTGWINTQKVEQKKWELMKMLETDGIKIIWNLNSAQYNPPLSFPYLRRNEIIAEIE